MQSFILDRHTDPSNPTMKVTQDNKVPIYDSKADAEADLANIEEGAIVATKDTGATEKVVDVVEDGNMNPVTSNAVFDAMQSTIIDVTHTFQGISSDWTDSWSIFLPAGKWAYSIIGNSSSKSAVVGMLATPVGWMDIPRSNPTLDYSSSSVQICAGVIDAGTTGRTISFQYYCDKSPADTLIIRVLAVKVGE